MGQQEILEFLESREDDDFYSTKEIRDALGMCSGAVARALKKLRKDEYIEYMPCGALYSDGRRNQYLYRAVERKGEVDNMRTHKKPKKNEEVKLTPEEIAQAQAEAETEALGNARIIGRLTIQSATELAPLKAKYYKKMYEKLQMEGFSKQEALEITKHLKV